MAFWSWLSLARLSCGCSCLGLHLATGRNQKERQEAPYHSGCSSWQSLLGAPEFDFAAHMVGKGAVISVKSQVL